MRPLLARNGASERLRHVEDAVEVDRDHRLPVLGDGVRVGREGVAAGDAGIVDEDRDLAELLGDLRRHGAAGGAVGDVEREGLRLAAGVADQLARSRPPRSPLMSSMATVAPSRA